MTPEAPERKDWRKETYPSPAVRDAEFAAEPEEEEPAGSRLGDLQEEDGCCNGVVQTAWQIGTASAPLVTPRMNDNNRERRIRQQQPPVLQTCATEETDGRGWRTIARDRAVNVVAIDWDEAVTVEDLAMSTVEAVVPSGRLCCA